MSEDNKDNKKIGNLTDLTGAGFAYKVIYYEDEACKRKAKTVILADSLKQAAIFVEEEAFSASHVLSIEEVGSASIPIKAIIEGWNRLELIKEKYKDG